MESRGRAQGAGFALWGASDKHVFMPKYRQVARLLASHVCNHWVQGFAFMFCYGEYATTPLVHTTLQKSLNPKTLNLLKARVRWTRHPFSWPPWMPPLKSTLHSTPASSDTFHLAPLYCGAGART